MATSQIGHDSFIDVVKSTNTWTGYFNMVIMDLVFRIADLFLYRKDGTVNRWMEANVLPLVHWPASYHVGKGQVTIEDVVVDSESGVAVRIYKPKGSNSTDQKLPVVMFIHGGGFVLFKAFDHTFTPFCNKIAVWCNAVVVSVEYRRAPEFSYPTAYDDCFNAIEWLASPKGKSHLPGGADLSQFFLMGDSAGGNIVHFVGCRLVRNNISPIKLRGMVLLQPFFGGEDLTKAEKEKHYILTVPFTRFCWKAYFPDKNRNNPYSNVFGPNAFDISDLALPPVWVAIGSKDCLRDRQKVYVEKLKELGKDVTAKYFEGVAHAFYVTGTASQADVCMENIRDFVHLHKL